MEAASGLMASTEPSCGPLAIDSFDASEIELHKARGGPFALFQAGGEIGEADFVEFESGDGACGGAAGVAGTYLQAVCDAAAPAMAAARKVRLFMAVW